MSPAELSTLEASVLLSNVEAAVLGVISNVGVEKLRTPVCKEVTQYVM